MHVRIAVVVFSLGLVGAAQAENWQRYEGSTGFTVSVPTERFAISSETPGRLSLSEIGGSAQLDIFGVTNPDRLSVGKFEKMMEAADPGRRITYRMAGRNWFVLSGYLDDEPAPTVFYAKFMLNRSGTALSAFEISYPASRKATFDALVEQMEDSLTSPR